MMLTSPWLDLRFEAIPGKHLNLQTTVARLNFSIFSTAILILWVAFGFLIFQAVCFYKYSLAS